MTPASFHRSYVLSDDNRFTSLAAEQRERLERRYHHGPDIQAAVLMAVATVGACDVLEIGAGSGALAALIGDHTGARVVAADSNAALTADAGARDLAAVAADVAALPFGRASMGCVVADRVLRRKRDMVDGLHEICRVLRDDGTLIAVVRSNTRDGHELDAMLGVERRRRAYALSTENGREVLSRRFVRIEEETLDYALQFPDGKAAAEYAATLPGCARLARRLATIAHTIEVTYGVTLFIAEAPVAA